jgi:hypothetical protein
MVKICAYQLKRNTKTVYACRTEEYCLPRCSLLALLQGKCGCERGCCGDLRIRQRLVVKKVDACPTQQCVPVEVPVTCPEPCPPTAPYYEKPIGQQKR